MQPRNTITVGVPTRSTAELFVSKITQCHDDECVESCSIRADHEAGEVITQQHHKDRDGNQVISTYRTPRERYAEGLSEWGEQALLFIVDTPDHWLRNAIAVSAGNWEMVDPEVTDWAEHVLTGWIPETFGQLASVETIEA